MKKLAFIKIGGLASGGIEKYLQLLAVSLKREGCEIDYYYTDGFIFKNGWKHPGTVPERKKFLEENGVKTYEIKIDTMDDFEVGGMWYGHNFFDVFNDEKYDYVIGGSKGMSSFPFNQIKTPVIETVHGTSWNFTNSYYKNVLITDYQIPGWYSAGGKAQNTTVIPPLVEIPEFSQSRRYDFGFNNETIIFGLHQSDRQDIFSPIPLEVYREIENEKTAFLMIGGSADYRAQAQRLRLKTFIYVPFQQNQEELHNFLFTLDVYLHGRHDGEVCSAALIEAMSHNLPIVSHSSHINNGHKVQLEDCGFFCETKEEYIKSAKLLLDINKRNEVRIKTGKKYRQTYEFDVILDAWKELLS